MFRVPSEGVVMFCFSLSILAGFGVSILMAARKNDELTAQKRLLEVLTVLSVLSILATLLMFLAKAPIIDYGTGLAKERYYSLHQGGTDFKERYLSKIGAVYTEIATGLLWFTLFFSAGIILLWLRVCRKLGLTLFALLVAVLIIADLWAFSLPSIQLKRIDEIYPKTELLQLLENDISRYRVLDLSGYIPQQVLPMYGIESITGYDPLVLKDYILLTNLVANTSEEYTLSRSILTNVPLEYASMNRISNTKILDILNTKYIISREPAMNSSFELVLEKQDYMLEKEFDTFKHYSNQTLPLYVYKNKNLLPRAFIVGDARIIPNRQQILIELNNNSFDPRKYVILERELGKPLQGEDYFEEANITFYSPNKITIEANLEEPGILFMSEIWQPDWKAKDNGAKTEIYRANYIFRSIYVPAGYHRIEMYYDPSLFKIGLILSLTTAALVVLAFVVPRFKK
jgi:hypothetical protein